LESRNLRSSSGTREAGILRASYCSDRRRCCWLATRAVADWTGSRTWQRRTDMKAAACLVLGLLVPAPLCADSLTWTFDLHVDFVRPDQAAYLPLVGTALFGSFSYDTNEPPSFGDHSCHFGCADWDHYETNAWTVAVPAFDAVWTWDAGFF